MAGKFERLSDLEWKLFEDLMPQSPEKRGRGMPHAPFRKGLNPQLYVLITGSRWCDVPQGEQWTSKSSAHRWLKRWYEDGTLEKLKPRILAVAEERAMSDWKYGAVDGSACSVFTRRRPPRRRCAFSPWQRWR